MSQSSLRVAAVAVYAIVQLSVPVSAQQVEACKLVPKEQVKKHVPWIALLDDVPLEEAAIGTSGSSCNYPTVFVQVLPFNQGTVDALRKEGALETVGGVGDEAYFRNNKDRYAELLVRVGARMVTLQADGEGKMDAAKSGVIELARLYATALR